MTLPSPPKQEKFFACYRGGQSRLHHMAYLRMCKVFVILQALRKTNCVLGGKRIFDYAFGAGTFFRFCPQSAHIFGVELDDETVVEVRNSLADSGHSYCDLRPIAISNWRDHELLRKKYDVIICSHVLEHLEHPISLLCALGQCLVNEGILISVVPINEIRPNPHHLQVVDENKLAAWGKSANLQMTDFFACDHIGWPVQPLLAADKGLTHKLARALSLLLGVPLSLAGLSVWCFADKILASLGIPPSQACAVFSRAANRKP